MTERQKEVFETIKGHLVGRGLDEERITPRAHLLGDLDLDSLDTMEMTLSLEEKFAIEIPDEELQGLETVQDAVELIERKLPVTA
ncbi:MAG TPA: acyl carrier protein [Actinomycetota bacterium]|nr:acyl carrier protein [Actinomycetota bacterium]